MSTQPPTPPAKTPPPIKKPKLNIVTRNALNNAVEDAQEWLETNDKALRAQAVARIDQATDWMESVAKPAVDKAITWVGVKINALKF